MLKRCAAKINEQSTYTKNADFTADCTFFMQIFACTQKVYYFYGRMKVEIEDIRIVVERKFVSEIRLVSICRTDGFSTK